MMWFEDKDNQVTWQPGQQVDYRGHVSRGEREDDVVYRRVHFRYEMSRDETGEPTEVLDWAYVDEDESEGERCQCKCGCSAQPWRNGICLVCNHDIGHGNPDHGPRS